MIMKGLRAIACATEYTAPEARKAAGDFAIGAGFAARDGARERVDALVEGGNAGHIERDVGKVAVAAAQQRDDAFDRDLDIQRRAQFAGVGIELEQPPPGFDLARFGQLHAHHAEIAPCDAASADPGVENGVPTPRHTPPTPADHNTATKPRIWKILGSVKGGGRGEAANPLGGPRGLG